MPQEPFLVRLRWMLVLWFWLLTFTLVGGGLALAVLWVLRFLLDRDASNLPSAPYN